MAPHTVVLFDDPAEDAGAVLHNFSRGEVALHAVSRLAVVFALSLALILILGQQLQRPF
ncbi:MAG TPA: hypothetical protein VKI19_13175 [Acidimicrobiales bacterium]|nr:hypothetical protein [Acidimicrobiales bacterium]